MVFRNEFLKRLAQRRDVRNVDKPYGLHINRAAADHFGSRGQHPLIPILIQNCKTHVSPSLIVDDIHAITSGLLLNAEKDLLLRGGQVPLRQNYF